MIDIKDVNVKAAHQKAIDSALNNAAMKIKTLIKRELDRGYGIPQRLSERLLTVRFARHPASKATIFMWSMRIDLNSLKRKPRKGSAGVILTIKDTTELTRKTFMQTMPEYGFQGRGKGRRLAEEGTAKTGVFERYGEKRPMKYGRYAGKVYKQGPKKGMAIQREPIRELSGPIVASLGFSKEMVTKMQKLLEKELVGIYIRRMNNYLYRR